jgi:glycosyltransferase involved in cell wall biosynthesis
MKSTICIIPFYNEEPRIDLSTFTCIFSTNKDTLFYLVDDGSSDNTYEILSQLKSTNDNVKLIKNNENVGKGESIRHAMLDAYKTNDFEFVGFYDSDFATPFSEYQRLAAKIREENLDLIFASRVKLYGRKISRNAFRHMFSRIFITISNSILNLEIYDSQCGCKIMHRDLIPLCFNDKFLSKWLFDIEMFIRIFNKGRDFNVQEEPIMEWRDVGGSKIKWTDFLKFPIELLKIFMKYKFVGFLGSSKKDSTDM